MAGFAYSFGFPLGDAFSAAQDPRVSDQNGAVAFALTDQEIDPTTLDFVDTDDGAWSETADSRSIVLCQLEIDLGYSYTTPEDGTDRKERIRSGEPLTAAQVEADVRRAMGLLERDGILRLLDVQTTDEDGRQLRDDAKRDVVFLSWIDLATGSPVDTAYVLRG